MKLLRNKTYFTLKGMATEYKKLNSFFDEFTESQKNVFRTIWLDELANLPKRCKTCRKKVDPDKMWYQLHYTGIGCVTLAQHHCGHIYDITKYEDW